jgi:hypothetical protein
MITRTSLSLLAGTTLVLLAIAGLIGQNHHGTIDTIGRIAWFGFLACAFFLIVASVATIARHRGRPRRS